MKHFVLLSFILLIFSSISESRRGGGGFRSGGSSSRSGGGWFGGSSSRSSSSGGAFGSGSQSSYPKQGWGTGGGRNPSSGGSSSYPKQSWSSGGKSTAIGGGGFVNPKATSYGSSFGSSNTYSYKSPGYGTRFGTSFPNGVGKYGGNGFSKKALGLGVGAGFIGGAALGAAGTVAAMGVYHRYMQYRLLTGGLGYGSYYNNYYYGNNCFGGCPYAAHCEWGFCECNRGFYKRWGQCTPDPDSARPRDSNFNPFVECRDNTDCYKIDTNLICNTNKTIQNGGICECRQDMKWNKNAGECQLFIDVDCSSITYDTKPSPVVLEAVNKTLDSLEGKNVTVDIESKSENETLSASPNVTLANSLLSSIDTTKASQQDIKEAFCRDVDSFSWEFGQPERYSSSSSSTNIGRIIGIIIGVLAISVICCVCCACFVCKGAKDKLSGVMKSDDSQGGGVTFSSVQTAGDTNYPSYPAQPQIYPDQPAAIPPTQPGYNNYPPPYTNNQSHYPPATNQMPYPPVSHDTPYPPTNQAPYPPFNPGPQY